MRPGPRNPGLHQLLLPTCPRECQLIVWLLGHHLVIDISCGGGDECDDIMEGLQLSGGEHGQKRVEGWERVQAAWEG